MNQREVWYAVNRIVKAWKEEDRGIREVLDESSTGIWWREWFDQEIERLEPFASSPPPSINKIASLTMLEAAGYLSGIARDIRKRRNPWWRFWTTDTRLIYAEELAARLKEIARYETRS